MQAKRSSNLTAKKSPLSFSRTGSPNGFGPGSPHLGFNITSVNEGPTGSGPPPSGLSTDTVSEPECYERSNAFVPLSHSRHLFSTDSVHLVLLGGFNRCICRTHRTVCHRCRFKESIS